MLKAIVDNLETVEEAFRSLYKETEEGKFTLQVTPVGGFALENIEVLKSAYQKEMAGRKRAEKRLSAFDDLDPAAARNALQKVEELSSLGPEKRG